VVDDVVRSCGDGYSPRVEPAGLSMSRCRCHRKFSASGAPHWWPMRDPEPDAEVRVVAFVEDDPAVLRMVRVPGGWHGEGVAAPHPDLTGPEPWALVGQCWAGREHPVVDVTRHSPRDRA
jgi:hypothetical protein